MTWLRSQGYRILDGCVGGVRIGYRPSKIVVLIYALVVGNPTHQVGWMSRHGHELELATDNGVVIRPASGFRYKEPQPGVPHRLEFDEESASPTELSKGTESCSQSKEENIYAGTPA